MSFKLKDTYSSSGMTLSVLKNDEEHLYGRGITIKPHISHYHLDPLPYLRIHIISKKFMMIRNN